MHVYVSQQAAQTYLVRIEGIAAASIRAIDRARAMAAIRAAFEPVDIRYLPTVRQVLVLPSLTAVLSGTQVVTVGHPADAVPLCGIIWNLSGRRLLQSGVAERLAVGMPA